jgi:hypothetical protein
MKTNKKILDTVITDKNIYNNGWYYLKLKAFKPIYLH